MDNICYTVISGPYDKLNTPKTISKGWKYICFTDQNIVSNIWEIRPIPPELSYLSQVKRQRCLKTQPHKYLPEHEWSVYVDANITINVGMWKLVRDICQKEDFSVTRHPQRDCIYEERQVCIRMKKDNGIESEAQIKRYKQEGFPEHYGLNETNLLVRHNVDWVRGLDDMWWNEIENGSHRDQLSFNYCLWKGGFRIHNLPKMIVRGSEFFCFNPGHKSLANKHRVNLAIVHFNTPELTSALYYSICKFTSNSEVYIFDNSDTRPFPYEKFPLIHYIDNTKGQIIDFDKWLKDNGCNENTFEYKANKYASAKHCYTIDVMTKLIGKNFILLDSDILLKKDISSLVSDKHIFACTVEIQPHQPIYRALPYICFLNVDMMKKYNVPYFDRNYMCGMNYNAEGKQPKGYDTGAGFYIHAHKYPHNKINYNDYIVHMGGGSWLEGKNKRMMRNLSETEWLEKFKTLWM